jgi:MscS family membrane protein
VDQEIDELTISLGLEDETFLGLPVEDWFNLGFSVLVVAVGYFLGYKLLLWFLHWIAHRASRELNEKLLKKLEPDLKLLLLVIFSRYGILRLDFLGDDLRTTLDDIYFVVIMVLVSIIVIQFINYSLETYNAAHHKAGKREKLDPALKVIQRIADLVVVIIAASFTLSHFGIGTSALTAGVLLTIIVLYMGTKDIIADVVAGFIIMADQPFRIGDVILIKEIDTLGTVLEIGTRTTRIRTGDNREVVVPNSDINKSQVVNYTYPDSRYRIFTNLGIAYGTDFDQMRKLIYDTVRGVEGVLPEKPVDIFFTEFGGSTRLVRVQWWINDFRDENRVLDNVNAALEVALDQAGIKMPNTTYDLNLKTEQLINRPREGNAPAHDQ